jgi:effector-binding domain-containing protein
MRFLKITSIIIVVLIAAFFIIAAFLPAKFHVGQSVVIDRPVEYPFNMVNTLINWEKWSPFSQNDSSLVNSYTGPASGVGSVMSWSSKKQGSGTMKISESVPFEKIITKLDFGEQGTSTAYFGFEEKDGKTTVFWGMDAVTGYPVERVVYALMKSSIEKVFNKGLQNLKSVCESIPYKFEKTGMLSSVPLLKDGNPGKPGKSPVLYALKLNGVFAAVIKDSCTSSEMAKVMEKDYRELMNYIFQNHSENSGKPATLWYSYDEETTFGVFETAIPVGEMSNGIGNIKVRKIQPNKVIAGLHTGPYENTMYMYQAIMKYLKDNNLQEAGGPVEIYLNNPSTEPDPEKRETVIMFQVK